MNDQYGVMFPCDQYGVMFPYDQYGVMFPCDQYGVMFPCDQYGVMFPYVQEMFHPTELMTLVVGNRVVDWTEMEKVIWMLSVSQYM